MTDPTPDSIAPKQTAIELAAMYSKLCPRGTLPVEITCDELRLLSDSLLAQEEKLAKCEDALKDMMAIARYYMRKENECEPDEFCNADVRTHGARYEQAHSLLL